MDPRIVSKLRVAMEEALSHFIFEDAEKELERLCLEINANGIPIKLDDQVIGKITNARMADGQIVSTVAIDLPKPAQYVMVPFKVGKSPDGVSIL